MAHIRPTSTTDEVLSELGSRLRRYRLQQNKRLEDIAAAAGVSVLTAQRAESGKNATMATVVRLLRALGRMDALDAFLPEPLVSPIALAERGGRVPQRASSPMRRPRKRGRQDG